uniref:Uncharacterized protein n=1 Tax=Anguilla anguilla TaxID=7936 RepID=A0A0E9XC54_ANGAN
MVIKKVTGVWGPKTTSFVTGISPG